MVYLLHKFYQHRKQIMTRISFRDRKDEINLNDTLPDLVWVGNLSIAEKTKITSGLPTAGGLLRIRWARNSALKFPRQAIIHVSYGYSSQKEKQLEIISDAMEDILYIGKALDIRERVFRIFSRKQSSNSTARKILALLKSVKEDSIGQQCDDISNEELIFVKSEIVLDYMIIDNPLLRDFMKAYAVSTEKSCLNVGLEH